MKVIIKYFGIIAETADKKEEILDVAQGMPTTESKVRQIKIYQIPDAKSIQLAVNQNLNTEVKFKRRR